jgi:hypothetical protein
MRRGVIDDWDERRGRGWVVAEEGTIFFPRIALCNVTSPRAGQQCFYRVSTNERGSFCSHVFVVSDTEEPTA